MGVRLRRPPVLAASPPTWRGIMRQFLVEITTAVARDPGREEAVRGRAAEAVRAGEPAPAEPGRNHPAF